MSALPAAPLTVKDVAALASVHEHTVRRAIRDGHLEAFRRLGSTVYAIRPDAFERCAYASASRRARTLRTFRHRRDESAHHISAEGLAAFVGRGYRCR